MMFPSWLTLTRGLIALAVLALVVAFLASRSCSSSRQEARQAKHETKTAGAYSEAAKEAVATVAARAEGEAELREVVAEAAKEISYAEGSEQKIAPGARDAALRAACRLPNYRDEPACRLLAANP
jgi:hypothetical protein